MARVPTCRRCHAVVRRAAVPLALAALLLLVLARAAPPPVVTAQQPPFPAACALGAVPIPESAPCPLPLPDAR